MKVITSAARFMDIDAYAYCIAYAELLQLLGEDAVAAGTALWNESITPSIAALNAPFDTNYKPTTEDTFVIMDVSNPDDLDMQA